MSIQTRLEEAKLLIENGRYEGALLCVLIALAATSQRRFPRGKTQSILNPKKRMGDGESFQTFISQEIPKITDANSFNIEFQGKKRPLGEVLYKWLRCHSVHEAELAPEIEFIPDPTPGQLFIKNQSGPPEIIIFSHSLIIFLADMVARAPENADLLSNLRDDIMKLFGAVT
jgi:hypothetical protein